MHWLGTCTAQAFNKRHERAGHLYQGRFGSRLIADDGYLLELARYFPLNPVRAGLSSSPAELALVELRGDGWPSIDSRRFSTPGRCSVTLGSRDAYGAWVD